MALNRDAIAATSGFNTLWLSSGTDTMTLGLGGLADINNFSVTRTKIDLARVGSSEGVTLAASGFDTLVVSSSSSVLGNLKFASIDTVAANSVSIFGSEISTVTV